ncbi:MAG TPA: hypothetical protein VFL83_19595 [Anaeromyxobacter sp.]|nr:hypothetical protein [Anaeromyxobacter sp.]
MFKPAEPWPPSAKQAFRAKQAQAARAEAALADITTKAARARAGRARGTPAARAAKAVSPNQQRKMAEDDRLRGAARRLLARGKSINVVAGLLGIGWHRLKRLVG